ncbi:MAG: hypothetical protein ACOYLB_01345 [Phototrophicaceae bacterium]
MNPVSTYSDPSTFTTLVATYTGMSGQALRHVMCDGKLLANTIEANGYSVETFIQEVMQQFIDCMNHAINQNKVKNVACDQLILQLEQRLRERLYGTSLH